MICVGLTWDQADRVWASALPSPRRVLCDRELPALSLGEPSPDVSLVRCASELPFLSHCADDVLLSARLLPDAVLVAEARRVLAPHGLLSVTPSALGHWDEVEQERVVSELEAAGLVVDSDSTAEWNQYHIIFAYVPHRRRL